jgi:glyoxalase family protein
MKLEGIHHVTAITGDAPRNLDFYTRVLGLRLVKKTVNQDDPTVYHLFYGDEEGNPGNDLTFFEYPGAAPGRAGAGMVHRVVWRVGSDDALEFWASRLAGEGVAVEREERRLRFADPEGLGHELTVSDVPDSALTAEHPEIPQAMALQGFDAVQAFATNPERSRALLEQTLSFTPDGREQWEARGGQRGGLYRYDTPPPEPGIPGAGTVHHVAWAAPMAEHAAWQETVARGGAHPTPVIDRFWFHSIYFREPSGVLFEIASIGPGFATDEAPEHLGESLVLPPAFEPLRSRIEPLLTPLPDPRAGWRHRTTA